MSKVINSFRSWFLRTEYFISPQGAIHGPDALFSGFPYRRADAPILDWTLGFNVVVPILTASVCCTKDDLWKQFYILKNFHVNFDSISCLFLELTNMKLNFSMPCICTNIMPNIYVGEQLYCERVIIVQITLFSMVLIFQDIREAPNLEFIQLLITILSATRIVISV